MRKISSDYEILKEYIKPEDETIVDVGCGTGELVRWMASQKIEAIGIDVAGMIKKAKKNPRVKNEKYIIGSGQQLPFNQNFADVITYIASFHHIPSADMEQALKECHRVLKPKGKVIIIEPVAEKDSYYEIIKLAEDEAEIQNYAYGVLQRAEEVNLKIFSEEIFYLERSFQDYVDLLNIFIDSESEKTSMIKKARETTLKLSEMAGDNFEEFKYKSIARLIIVEKTF